MKYEEVLSDWEYLFETIGAADDMTGGYVDQDDLDKLLKNPTKSQAKECLRDQMRYWFQVGPDNENTSERTGLGCEEERDRLIEEDPRVSDLYDKYC